MNLRRFLIFRDVIHTHFLRVTLNKWLVNSNKLNFIKETLIEFSDFDT